MFRAWTVIKSNITFKVSAQYVYNQPLFYNTNIVLNHKTLLRNVLTITLLHCETFVMQLYRDFYRQWVWQRWLCNTTRLCPRTTFSSYCQFWPRVYRWKAIITSQFSSNCATIDGELVTIEGRAVTLPTRTQPWYQCRVKLYYREPTAHAFCINSLLTWLLKHSLLNYARPVRQVYGITVNIYDYNSRSGGSKWGTLFRADKHTCTDCSKDIWSVLAFWRSYLSIFYICWSRK
jgi:hypothetical protein